MTFTKTNMKYRVAFDTTTNQFMAIDASNEKNVAFGVTIEQAVRALNVFKIRSDSFLMVEANSKLINNKRRLPEFHANVFYCLFLALCQMMLVKRNLRIICTEQKEETLFLFCLFG